MLPLHLIHSLLPAACLPAGQAGCRGGGEGGAGAADHRGAASGGQGSGGSAAEVRQEAHCSLRRAQHCSWMQPYMLQGCGLSLRELKYPGLLLPAGRRRSGGSRWRRSGGSWRSRSSGSGKMVLQLLLLWPLSGCCSLLCCRGAVPVHPAAVDHHSPPAFSHDACWLRAAAGAGAAAGRRPFAGRLRSGGGWSVRRRSLRCGWRARCR